MAIPRAQARGPDWADDSAGAETGIARHTPRFDPTNQRHVRLRRLERLAWILDRSIPVGRWRIGLDPIIGLLPGLGDSVGALLSLYVLYEGARLGAPGHVLARMTGNILVETIIGAVPFLGDLFDFMWQANTRNLQLIRRHHAPHWEPRSLRAVWLSVLVATVLVLAVIIALAYAAFNFLSDLIQRG